MVDLLSQHVDYSHAQMMTEMLEDEPGAINDIQEMLEKSNGNMFAIMSNPKFQVRRSNCGLNIP